MHSCTCLSEEGRAFGTDFFFLFHTVTLFFSCTEHLSDFGDFFFFHPIVHFGSCIWLWLVHEKKLVVRSREGGPSLMRSTQMKMDLSFSPLRWKWTSHSAHSDEDGPLIQSTQMKQNLSCIIVSSRSQTLQTLSVRQREIESSLMLPLPHHPISPTSHRHSLQPDIW